METVKTLASLEFLLKNGKTFYIDGVSVFTITNLRLGEILDLIGENRIQHTGLTADITTRKQKV